MLSNAFYRTLIYLGSDLWVCMSVCHRPCWYLTDVTLADEHTNSILTEEVNDIQKESVHVCRLCYSVLHHINMDKLKVLARFLVLTSSWRPFGLTLALWPCDRSIKSDP